MGRIRINTPQGIATVDIEGDTISADELDRLRQLAPPEAGETFDYTVVEDETVTEETPAPEPEPELITGEVRDTLLRLEIGRMDDDEEKANLLTIKLGEGTVEHVGPDTFIIDQDKVSPEIRQKYGLGDTGKIYFNKPGFTLPDLADFAGAHGPVVVGAIGASIAASSLAWAPAMAVVGTTAMAVKAIDEGIEWLQGLNRQSAGEVAAAIAIEGPLNAIFEGGGRFAAALLGRAFKGPGPQVSSQRIAEIAEQTGKSTREATRMAKEEARIGFREMIGEGARPTLFAATGKSLASRVMAINEKIMPNQKVARANVQYIETVLKDLESGLISPQQAQQLMKNEYDSIAALMNVKMADPDQIYKVIQSHLDDVVKTELEMFERAFVPATGVPSQYVEGAQLAANLFRAESKATYDLAEAQMGKGVKFDLAPIKDTIKRLNKENRFIAYTGSLFDEIADSTSMTLSDLVQLKQALRLSSGSPDLVATAAQSGVSQIIRSVDEVIDSTFSKLSLDVVRGYRLVPRPAGSVDATGKLSGTFGTQFVRDPLGPAENEALRQGLGAWKKANDFYSKGQDIINNTAVNSIIKNARDKFYNSNVDVVKQIVEGGNAPKLRMYLNAATPSPQAAAKISRPGAQETIDQIQGLVANGQFNEAARLIGSSGLRDILPTLNPWIGKLPADDVFRVMHTDQYLKEMDSLSLLARAGADPQAIRNSVRNGLAKVWTDRAVSQSEDPLGRFASGKFASQFSALGRETQDLLFGAPNASRMRNVMEEFRLLGPGKGDVIKALRPLPEGFGAYPAGGLQAQIQSLKQAVDVTVAQSDDAFAAALRQGGLGSTAEGAIYDSASLVSSLLKHPGNFARLRNVVGDAQLNQVGGVKDMVMQNLIRNSFNKLDEASIQSGTWGKELLKNIVAQNKNGALGSILGQDVVSSLTKVAESAVKISDVPIRGFGSLVAATTALAVGGAFMSFSPIAWATAGAALVPIFLVSRAFRNRTILGLMTSPRMRAREYEAAIKAGADLPTIDALKNAGPLVFATNRIASILATEASIIAGSGILNVPISESEKVVQEEIRTRPPGQLSRRERTAEQFTPQRPFITEEEFMRGAEIAPNIGARPVPRGLDALRQVEQNKLLGIAPGQ